MVEQRCDEIDRDPATLETSMLVGVVVGDGPGTGVSADLIPDEMKQRMVVGNAAQVAEQIKARVLDAGIDGVIVHIPTQVIGFQAGQITALGEALKPLVAG